MIYFILFFLSNLILFDEAKTLEAETMNKRSDFNTYWFKEEKQTNANTVKDTRTEKTTDSLVITIENKQNSFMSK